MDIDVLLDAGTGNLVPISGTDPRTGTDFGHYAFIPNPLPDSVELSMATLDETTKASMAVARLDQAISQLPNPSMLVRPIIRREAQSTSALEGTYAAFAEILEADFLADSQLSSEQREIANYVRATELAVRLLDQYPISRPLLGQDAFVCGREYEALDIAP